MHIFKVASNSRDVLNRIGDQWSRLVLRALATPCDALR